MDGLKVLVIGASAAESLRLEDAFQRTGYLGDSLCLRWDQVAAHSPDWLSWDLVCACRPLEPENAVLPLLSPILRTGLPPVFFIVNIFNPSQVTHLWNIGATRVLTFDSLADSLNPCLSAVFGPDSLIRDPQIRQEPALADLQVMDWFSSTQAGMGILRLPDGVCVDCNEPFAQLLGYRQAEVIGKPVYELGSPQEIHELLAAKNGSARASKNSRQVERKIHLRDGETSYLLAQFSAMEQNHEKCVLAVVLDITEQVIIRERLRKQNKELEKSVEIHAKALLAANQELDAEMTRRRKVEEVSSKLEEIVWEIPEFVAICDLNGRVQYMNRIGRDWFGLGEQDSVDHMQVIGMFPPELHEKVVADIYPELVSKGVWCGEISLLLPQQHLKPVYQVLILRQSEDSSSSFIAGISHDISEFKEIVNELQQSRERYRALSEAAHDLIFRVSTSGVMEYANRFACEALKISPNIVEGMRLENFFPEELSNTVYQMIGEVQKINSAIYSEGPFYIGDDKRWLGTWMVPIHDSAERLVSILGIARDITEQKRADEALKLALDNQKQLNEIRINFFSMTSHQFRTPLSTIMLATSLLMKYSHRWEEKKRAEQLERIQASAQRLQKMLDDILMIGKVESGRYIPSARDFDLVQLCGDIIKEMSSNDQDEHTIQYLPEIDHLSIFTDEKLIERVVDNLLSNALKYSPNGTHIRLELRQEDGHIYLEVEDEGIGIPEKDIKQLFQPFRRASNVTDLPGTGIGLAIVRKSIELIHGDVYVKSKEGEGTTFVVRFPVRFEATVERS